ncbi:MAG: hypothetical protein M0Z53_06055 [Thermaerobacter sp.]|nr:hypothetical protein [Thermaerobacter sp.]
MESVLWANGLDSILWDSDGTIAWYRQGWYWPEPQLPRPAVSRWPRDRDFAFDPRVRWAELLPLLRIRITGAPAVREWDPLTQTARWASGWARQDWRSGTWELASDEADCLEFSFAFDPEIPRDWVSRSPDGNRLTWSVPGLPVLSVVLEQGKTGAGTTSLRVRLVSSGHNIVGPGPGLPAAPGEPACWVDWPSPGLKRLHANAPYRLGGAQDRGTGALTPGLSPQTWSGHVFWDAWYIARALEGLNMIERLLASARFFSQPGPWPEYAREEGRPGWRWPWEMTPDGREAFGAYGHLRREIHNQSAVVALLDRALAYANDEAAHGAILHAMQEGTRYLVSWVAEDEAGLTMPGVIGVDEDPAYPWADPATMAGTADAIRRLRRRGVAVPSPWDAIERGLRREVRDALHRIATSPPPRLSIAPLLCLDLYPVWDPAAPAARQIVDNFIACQGDVFMLGHGVSPGGFPWTVGMVARLRALAGLGEDALDQLRSLDDWVDGQGDLSETIIGVNRQTASHFATATASAVMAMHTLLGWMTNSGELHLLEAWPRDLAIPAWRGVRIGPFVTECDGQSIILTAAPNGTPPLITVVSGVKRPLPQCAAGESIPLAVVVS